MATLVASDCTGSGEKAVTETTMTASDTFTYVPGGNQYLVLRNASAGALTPNFLGDGVGTVSVKGAGELDISAGYTTASIGIGAVVVIRTSTIEKYLTGTIEITGGTDIEASILEY